MTFSGTSDRSVLGGNVTIERVAYDSQSDIGSMLSGASVPAEAPSAGPGLVSGMRMNIRVQTAPDVRFQTSLAEELSATADLRVLGSPLSPGMVGRIDIVSGTLVFFGNKYNVNRGAIAFYNAQKIEPILDIDLETTAKGVQVSLSVSGPIENMKLSYRSDPPLKFDDIVALLATGRTPPDPTIAARQPVTPDQSVTQMGESAILTQAVANPLANRLERVFGVSQLKIDPTFNTGSGYPTAKVTIQQQVTPTIIFTYSQDLTQTNSQILRIEMALTPRFSAVATRDDNGIFGVDFFYKKQFR
jgi:translocation and assembly module TamB